MLPEAYKGWISLYKEDFFDIWKNERKELQKVSVLLYALKNELKHVQTNIELEVSKIKQRLKYKDDLQKENICVEEKLVSGTDKEIGLEKQKQTCEIIVKNNQNRSPDLFRNADLNAHSSSTDISLIDLSISEEDTIHVDGSPTIKKRRKRLKPMQNQAVFNVISEADEVPCTPTDTPQQPIKKNLFKTPVPKSDHDLSIIDCTPQASIKRSRTCTKTSLFLSKKSKGKKNKSTLTQMFAKSSKNKECNTADDGIDSDETYFEENPSGTKMSISELIYYINKDDTKNQEASVSADCRNDETILDGLDTSSQEVDQFSKGYILNEADITMHMEDKVANIEPEPVVRGKARKQLSGWSCQQCKNFYANMKLSPEELQKKMDECSRHRYKYHPPEETVPGFWDLSIPPENEG